MPSDSFVRNDHMFRCPISGLIFLDPVMTSDGYTYERSSIYEWFQQKRVYVKQGTLNQDHIPVPNAQMSPLYTSNFRHSHHFTPLLSISPLTNCVITTKLTTDTVTKQIVDVLLHRCPNLKSEQFKLQLSDMDFQYFNKMVEEKKWNEIMATFDDFTIRNSNYIVHLKDCFDKAPPERFLQFISTHPVNNPKLIIAAAKAEQSSAALKFFINQPDRLTRIENLQRVNKKGADGLSRALYQNADENVNIILDNVTFSDERISINTQYAIGECSFPIIMRLMNLCKNLPYKIIEVDFLDFDWKNDPIKNVYEMLDSNHNLTDDQNAIIRKMIDDKLKPALKQLIAELDSNTPEKTYKKLLLKK